MHSMAAGRLGRAVGPHGPARAADRNDRTRPDRAWSTPGTPRFEDSCGSCGHSAAMAALSCCDGRVPGQSEGASQSESRFHPAFRLSRLEVGFGVTGLHAVKGGRVLLHTPNPFSLHSSSVEGERRRQPRFGSPRRPGGSSLAAARFRSFACARMLGRRSGGTKGRRSRNGSSFELGREARDSAREL